MLPANLIRLAENVNALSREHGLMIATAESCTGGIVAGALTEIAGSSSVLDRGFVTYSNEAKQEMLGVDRALIDTHGAVSEEVARAMADGALEHSNAGLAVSITGIAGPGGATASKPVGLVWFGVARTGQAVRTVREEFGELGRSQVRERAALTALGLLKEAF